MVKLCFTLGLILYHFLMLVQLSQCSMGHISGWKLGRGAWQLSLIKGSSRRRDHGVWKHQHGWWHWCWSWLHICNPKPTIRNVSDLEYDYPIKNIWGHQWCLNKNGEQFKLRNRLPPPRWMLHCDRLVGLDHPEFALDGSALDLWVCRVWVVDLIQYIYIYMHTLKGFSH